jgi:hypothetical protein
MPFSLKCCSEAHHYKWWLTLIAIHSSNTTQSSKKDEVNQKRPRSSSAAKLNEDLMNIIIRFCCIGRPMVVPKKWELQRMDNVPDGAGVMIVQHFIRSPPCVGLLAKKTQDNSAMLDVDEKCRRKKIGSNLVSLAIKRMIQNNADEASS